MLYVRLNQRRLRLQAELDYNTGETSCKREIWTTELVFKPNCLSCFIQSCSALATITTRAARLELATRDARREKQATGQLDF